MDLIDEVFVIHNQDSADSEEFLKTSGHVHAQYNLKIESIVIDDFQFAGLRADRHVSHATYYRFCLADFLPDRVQSVLLIDPDTIVTGKLTLLTELKFDEGSSLICYAVDHGIKSPQRLKSLSTTLDNYFNAGVLLLSVNVMRKEKISIRLLEFAIKHKEHLLFWDQDVLNIFFNKRTSQLPYSYNASSIKNRLKELPKVIHYTGNRKPWNLFCDHPYRREFWEVVAATPFEKDLRMQRKYGGVVTSVLLPIANMRDLIYKVLGKSLD